MSDQDEHHDLMFPFVVCTSQGGPFDDEAFVAGAQMATLETELRLQQPPLYERYVDTRLVPQIDLVAMHHGYAMEAEPWDEHPDEWTLVTLRKAGSSDE